MKKSIQQYFGNVDANYVYEAKFNYQIEDVVRVFKDNINRRHDLTDEVKKAALAKPIGKDYELVYYPTYFYKILRIGNKKYKNVRCYYFTYPGLVSLSDEIHKKNEDFKGV